MNTDKDNATQLFDRLTKGFPYSEAYAIIGDREVHEFLCDDRCGVLTVTVGPDGDLWAGMHEGDSDCHFGPPGVRARTYSGGGRSERVRQALMLLAVAMVADNRTLKQP